MNDIKRTWGSSPRAAGSRAEVDVRSGAWQDIRWTAASARKAGIGVRDVATLRARRFTHCGVSLQLTWSRGSTCSLRVPSLPFGSRGTDSSE